MDLPDSIPFALLVQRLGKREADRIAATVYGPSAANITVEAHHLVSAVKLVQRGISSTAIVNQAARAFRVFLLEPRHSRLRDTFVAWCFTCLRDLDPAAEAELHGVTLEERRTQLERMANARASRHPE
ncbi:MAG TPA: hypothetical protein VH208_06490, partial [Myxococcaceae bacterium]|nr:hypothetical protein [Myxococcaceae bacterium]